MAVVTSPSQWAGTFLRCQRSVDWGWVLKKLHLLAGCLLAFGTGCAARPSFTYFETDRPDSLPDNRKGRVPDSEEEFAEACALANTECGKKCFGPMCSVEVNCGECPHGYTCKEGICESEFSTGFSSFCRVGSVCGNSCIPRSRPCVLRIGHPDNRPDTVIGLGCKTGCACGKTCIDCAKTCVRETAETRAAKLDLSKYPTTDTEKAEVCAEVDRQCGEICYSPTCSQKVVCGECPLGYSCNAGTCEVERTAAHSPDAGSTGSCRNGIICHGTCLPESWPCIPRVSDPASRVDAVTGQCRVGCRCGEACIACSKKCNIEEYHPDYTPSRSGPHCITGCPCGGACIPCHHKCHGGGSHKRRRR